MHRRGFVLVPLAEIAPQAWHPVMCKSAGDLLSELDPTDRAAMQPLSKIEDKPRCFDYCWVWAWDIWVMW